MSRNQSFRDLPNSGVKRMNAATNSQKSSHWEETFILVFYRLLQAVRIHKDNNDLVKGCLLRLFKQTLAQLDIGGGHYDFRLRGAILHPRREAANPEAPGSFIQGPARLLSDPGAARTAIPSCIRGCRSGADSDFRSPADPLCQPEGTRSLAATKTDRKGYQLG